MGNENIRKAVGAVASVCSESISDGQFVVSLLYPWPAVSLLKSVVSLATPLLYAGI